MHVFVKKMPHFLIKYSLSYLKMNLYACLAKFRTLNIYSNEPTLCLVLRKNQAFYILSRVSLHSIRF